jgi:hypothetical protein
MISSSVNALDEHDRSGDASPSSPPDEGHRSLRRLTSSATSTISNVSSISSNVVIYDLRERPAERQALRSTRSLYNVRHQPRPPDLPPLALRDVAPSAVAKSRTVPNSPIASVHPTSASLPIRQRRRSDVSPQDLRDAPSAVRRPTRPSLPSRQRRSSGAYPWAPMLDMPNAIPPAHAIDFGNVVQEEFIPPRRRAVSAAALPRLCRASAPGSPPSRSPLVAYRPDLEPFPPQSPVLEPSVPLSPRPKLPPGARHEWEDWYVNGNAKGRAEREAGVPLEGTEGTDTPRRPVIDYVGREEDRWGQAEAMVKSETAMSSELLERHTPLLEGATRRGPYPTYGRERRDPVSLPSPFHFRIINTDSEL